MALLKNEKSVVDSWTFSVTHEVWARKLMLKPFERQDRKYHLELISPNHAYCVPCQHHMYFTADENDQCSVYANHMNNPTHALQKKHWTGEVLFQDGKCKVCKVPVKKTQVAPHGSLTEAIEMHLATPQHNRFNAVYVDPVKSVLLALSKLPAFQDLFSKKTCKLCDKTIAQPVAFEEHLMGFKHLETFQEYLKSQYGYEPGNVADVRKLLSAVVKRKNFTMSKVHTKQKDYEEYDDESEFDCVEQDRDPFDVESLTAADTIGNGFCTLDVPEISQNSQKASDGGSSRKSDTSLTADQAIHKTAENYEISEKPVNIDPNEIIPNNAVETCFKTADNTLKHIADLSALTENLVFTNMENGFCAVTSENGMFETTDEGTTTESAMLTSSFQPSAIETGTPSDKNIPIDNSTTDSVRPNLSKNTADFFYTIENGGNFGTEKRNLADTSQQLPETVYSADSAIRKCIIPGRFYDKAPLARDNAGNRQCCDPDSEPLTQRSSSDLVRNSETGSTKILSKTRPMKPKTFNCLRQPHPAETADCQPMSFKRDNSYMDLINPYHAYCFACSQHIYAYSDRFDICSFFADHVNDPEHQQRFLAQSSEMFELDEKKTLGEDTWRCNACQLFLLPDNKDNTVLLRSLVEKHLYGIVHLRNQRKADAGKRSGKVTVVALESIRNQNKVPADAETLTRSDAVEVPVTPKTEHDTVVTIDEAKSNQQSLTDSPSENQKSQRDKNGPQLPANLEVTSHYNDAISTSTADIQLKIRLEPVGNRYKPRTETCFFVGILKENLKDCRKFVSDLYAKNTRPVREFLVYFDIPVTNEWAVDHSPWKVLTPMCAFCIACGYVVPYGINQKHLREQEHRNNMYKLKGWRKELLKILDKTPYFQKIITSPPLLLLPAGLPPNSCFFCKQPSPNGNGGCQNMDKHYRGIEKFISNVLKIEFYNLDDTSEQLKLFKAMYQY